jgi:hypothetical protein
MADQRCENCRFFLVDGVMAICRRNPPMPYLLSIAEAGAAMDMKTVAVWPPAHPLTWCGEWRSKEAATITVLHPVGPRQDIVPPLRGPQEDDGA